MLQYYSMSPTHNSGQGEAQALPLRTPRSRLLAHQQVRSRARERSWDERVGIVRQLAATPGFQHVRDEIIGLADLRPSDHLLDLGAGTGLLSLAAAPAVARVTAIDIAAPMCEALERDANARGLTNIETRVADAVDLPLADESVDVVVSSYCLHHLRDEHKRVALAEIRRVLRPGGRLVIGDMMFRMGLSTPRDRAVIGGVIRRLIRRGPAGLLRIVRNVGRVAAGRAEHPAGPEWWHEALVTAGFVEVRAWALEHEGGIAAARRPAP